MDSEEIDYKALYEQVRTELEKHKLETWIRGQRHLFHDLGEMIVARLQDMTIPEWVIVLVMISAIIHYHQAINQIVRART